MRLEDEAPAVRVRTIREIARRQERDLVPALIDRLDDEDAAVRLYAILALEQLMGTRMGYAYSAPAEERRAAIEAWRHSLLDSARPTDQEAHRPVEPG